MPRIARGLAGNHVYHVINRGNGRQDVFHKDGDYGAFVRLIGEAKERYAVKVLAYCLMPNHFHLVLAPEQGEYLSKWMQWIMTSHVRRYHNHYGSSGHVWQGRYKSFIVQGDVHLITVLRYVEGNPVRAGLVGTAREWQWSSHRETTGSVKRSVVDEVMIRLPDAWEAFVNEPLTAAEMERLRLSASRQSPYGDVEWQEKVCAELGLESTMRSRGRPRKESEYV